MGPVVPRTAVIVAIAAGLAAFAAGLLTPTASADGNVVLGALDTDQPGRPRDLLTP
jgi:hypothetical protein